MPENGMPGRTVGVMNSSGGMSTAQEGRARSLSPIADHPPRRAAYHELSLVPRAVIDSNTTQKQPRRRNGDELAFETEQINESGVSKIPKYHSLV